MSERIAQMGLESNLHDGALDADAYKLANCDAHSRLIARSIENLLVRHASTSRGAEKLLCDLIGGQTYGKFAEIAAYEWLGRYPFKFLVH